MALNSLRQELRGLGNPERAAHSRHFFKTAKGEYGYGDKFLGLSVPVQRKIAKKYKDLPLQSIESLLKSKVHEERLIALMILVEQFKYKEKQKEIYPFYLSNTKRVNNWDLVDLSAHKIIGEFLIDKDRKILYKLVKSKVLWDRRIAIVATFAFIKNNDLKDTIKISEMLLNDKHDLIHKAVGWMLREVGKKDVKTLENFLAKHASRMPRTALRYAIERLEPLKRKYYLTIKSQ